MLHVVWAEGEKAPVVEVTSKFATRDRAVDLTKPGNAPALSRAERKLYTPATDLIPTDGIVKETSDKITAGADQRSRQGARASTSGSSTTPSAMPRRAAAASATSPRC